MTSLADAGRLDPDRLLTRVQALEKFLHATDGHLPADCLGPARTVVEHAAQRLALSRDHTVVALAGSTGSGKSSLFNALAGMDLSPVGARRPTTSAAYACVWGSAPGAAELLDWLGVAPPHRFARESVLDGESEAPLRGLVLLDLPDFDSITTAHRAEVDRVLGLVDLVVWVVDPQKYADRLIHHSYLRHFPQYREVTAVALNQCDRLSGGDARRCLNHLRDLLDADGLSGVTALTSSAYGWPGHDELRALLERAVAVRRAALQRLAADVEQLAAELSTMVGAEVPDDLVGAHTARFLIKALAEAAGVPALAKAVEYSYRHRAARHLAWPPLRWLGRLRRDPLRRLKWLRPRSRPADATSTDATPAGTSTEPLPVQRAAVGLAVRAVAERAVGLLPEPWPAAVDAAARARLDELPDALDRVVTDTDIGLTRTPLSWRTLAGVQWLATLAAVAGLGWLVAGYVLPAMGLSAPDRLPLGPVPLPALLLVGGALLGIGIATLGRPAVASAARRARARALSRLTTAVAEVAQEYVIAPVIGVLSGYERARTALARGWRDR